jgi:predicted amidophosphoribosyltransferase
MPRIAKRAAAELSSAAGRVSVADCLALRRGVVDSAGLAPEERVRNLAGRVRLRSRRLPSGPLLLVDDVITTAATAASCAAALGQAGAELVGVVALTATAG